jgi:hypothetical protein
LPEEEDEVSQEVISGGVEPQELIDHASSSTAAEVRTFLDESLSNTQDSEGLAAPAVP